MPPRRRGDTVTLALFQFYEPNLPVKSPLGSFSARLWFRLFLPLTFHQFVLFHGLTVSVCSSLHSLSLTPGNIPERL